MHKITEISSMSKLKEFIDQRQVGPILFKDFYSPRKIEPCMFASTVSHFSDMKLSDYLIYPYDCSLGTEPKVLFDYILNHVDADIYFLVSSSNPKSLRYCEQFMARLQIYMESISASHDGMAESIILNSVRDSGGIETLETPCIIGITSNLKENISVPGWSFYWHLDHNATENWLKSLLLKIAVNHTEKYLEKDLANVLKRLQPVLYDIHDTKTTKAEEIENYQKKIANELKRLMSELPVKQLPPSRNAVLISLEEYIKTYPNSYNHVIKELTTIYSRPHDSMIMKANIMPDEVELLKADYAGIPIAFRKRFGKGSITVLPKEIEEEFIGKSSSMTENSKKTEDTYPGNESKKEEPATNKVTLEIIDWAGKDDNKIYPCDEKLQITVKRKFSSIYEDNGSKVPLIYLLKFIIIQQLTNNNTPLLYCKEDFDYKGTQYRRLMQAMKDSDTELEQFDLLPFFEQNNLAGKPVRTLRRICSWVFIGAQDDKGNNKDVPKVVEDFCICRGPGRSTENLFDFCDEDYKRPYAKYKIINSNITWPEGFIKLCKDVFCRNVCSKSINAFLDELDKK